MTGVGWVLRRHPCHPRPAVRREPIRKPTGFANLASPAVACVAFRNISGYVSNGLETHASLSFGCLARPFRQIGRFQAPQARGGRDQAGVAAGGGAGRSRCSARSRKCARRSPARDEGGESESGSCRAQASRQLRELHGRRHRGAGRPRARPAPARHVYRRHRREGPASPVRRGDRQRHGRGRGGPRHLDRGARSRRTASSA